ncbi:MAG: DAK2 domain-containing protein [Oscillospiraceae bacterium]|nr:DAK2 domain-containing protein [Oscillospiraceae bacterium]
MIEFIDGLALKKMFIAAAVSLDAYKEEINELNVFPVPDGDTGSNMSMTISSAMTELQKSEPDSVTKTADIAAGALLRGARGNSGVILSLLFRGFAKSVKEKKTINAAEMAVAFHEGVSTAYKAVMKPAEGTILTVSRLAADAACEAAENEDDIEKVMQHMIAVGEEALADTVNQNPVLKKAGVIDAGGKGYLIIIEAMLASLQGKEFAAPEVKAVQEVKEKADFSDFDTEDIKFAYCTEFIIGRENDKDPQLLREFLDKLGDSIVVVDDDEIIKVHVHNNCPGVVITEALTYGHIVTVKIENMKLQHTEVMEMQDAAPAEEPVAEPEKAIGVVVVCAGEGLEAMFKDLGADGVISGGQTMNPSTEDILKEINRTPAETVFVLPNNKNIVLAAGQCVGMSEKNVVVIPTHTVPQGVTALLALDPDGEVEANEAAMNEVLETVHTVTLTYAARNSNFDGFEIAEGDYLAMIENKLLTAGTDLATVEKAMGDTLAQFEPELVSVYYGEDVNEEQAQELADVLQECMPDAEVTVIPGGQPVYYYIISAE